MRQFLQIFGIGLLVGLCGIFLSALPIGSAWEEDFGLGTLFQWRGMRPAPSEVVVVSITDKTGPLLGYDNDLPSWPRSVHAKLVDSLSAAGAAVIVMDIDFRHAQPPDQDERFAASLRRAGNVILFGYLDQEMVRLDDAKPNTLSSNRLQIERLRKPVEVLADSAAAIAPFVLPKTPVKVSRFWTFHGANELATLPAAALEHYVLQNLPDLISLLVSLKPSLVEHFLAANNHEINRVRSLLRNDQQLVDELSELLDLHPVRTQRPTSYQQLKALLAMYRLSRYPYLNFYGPPRSITTIPYWEVISDEADILPSLKNKVVFVGFTEDYQPKQKDGFYTAFSQADGLDISGVEIAATGFANLLDRETIIPLEPAGVIFVLLGYGVIITLLFRLIPAYINVLAGLSASALYSLFVYQLFVSEAVWLPWVVPLFVLTPLSMVVALTLHYHEARNARQRLHEIFGYYLPERIIDRLTNDTSDALKHGESAFGVCLATDAEQYTNLAETMAPADLQAFLNRYYKTLFTPVRARDGMISDVVGDAMLAIWSAPHADKELRRKACEAALEINQTLKGSGSISKMPTRIGLHAGQFMLSHVGAIDHYEYRAVGDIVNTASRIENLNKLLGTSILASQETVVGLEGFVTRDLGMFRLKGKHQPVSLHEIVCQAADLTDGIKQLHELFADAVAAHQKESWQEAYEMFQAILRDYPKDGPSQFYLALYQDRRPENKITLQTPPQTGLRYTQH